MVFHNARSKFYHNWPGFCTGEDTLAEKTEDVIKLFMQRKGGMCFHRCQFSSMVLKDAGIDVYTGVSFLRKNPLMPHSLLFLHKLTNDHSLHLADMGNRVAPIFELVDMDFVSESNVTGSPLTQSKIIKTDSEKEPDKCLYQHVYRRKVSQKPDFQYYCDFDLTRYDHLSQDGSELHVDVSKNEKLKVDETVWAFQDLFLNRVFMLMGMNPSGCFVEYLNNAYRRYDENGQLAAQKFFKNKQSMVERITSEFPQFEESFVSRCLDAAVELDKKKSPDYSTWPNFS